MTIEWIIIIGLVVVCIANSFYLATHGIQISAIFKIIDHLTSRYK